jgi:hypothetical protein
MPACLPAALVLSVLLPAEPLLWLWFQHSTLVSSWRRYFQFSFVLEQNLDQSERYIFAGVRACVRVCRRLWCLCVYGVAPWRL